MSRVLIRMSPFRTWLNSCATTPWSSSRVSSVIVPSVTATADATAATVRQRLNCIQGALQDTLTNNRYCCDNVGLGNAIAYGNPAYLAMEAGMIIFFAMTASVKERVQEIGLFRAIGFRTGHIIQVLLIEAFFGIPGLGSYTIDAINAQDFAVVRSMVFIGSLLYILGLLLTDISAGLPWNWVLAEGPGVAALLLAIWWLFRRAEARER